ncbi:thioester domain-containing protein [Actinokineospora diospyrosa]|uniref:LPXTG-motif cell wall anchor domain-containing protein/TQXA domain-containing protein n=1 Tax=Actinokineospora diospyrosa TaxID=103728 RepID=A0ABT1IDC5_9PSEU|nr:thioester domain-containing protein [Actinokineospora diospyrosa]MCP2270614.1 LPXTG-motif cell wall anchor domain-containing protein/TQXA domain-containing protein [Actinokineospora diospyrosa]
MRSRWKVAAAAVSLAAVTGALAVSPASADKVTGTLQPTSAEDTGFTVRLVKPGVAGHEDVTPYLFRLNLSDGAKLAVYCVGAEIAWSFEADVMSEVPWGDYPDADSPFKANSKKVNWVLHHGYPNLSLEQLNDLGLQTNPDGIELEEAISATQAALWHFSDGLDLDRDNPVQRGNHDSDKDVLALYDYLTGDANKGIDEWVIGDLKISPDTLSGEVGKLVGPFKVTTNGTVTKLEDTLPNGVEITDADGKPLAAKDIKNGTEFFVKVPQGAAAGNGTVKISGDSPKVEVGRLFTGKTAAGVEAQPLIVAGSETKPLSAQAKVDWTTRPTTPPSSTTATTPPSTTTVPPTTTTTVAPIPQPSPGLPDTGASILVPALVGLGLLGGGAGALLYVRHRRRAA